MTLKPILLCRQPRQEETIDKKVENIFSMFKKNLKNNIKFKTISSFRSGFTLVELLVTLAIFSIITSVVLFQDNSLQGKTLVTNLAYEIALTIRQAQTYGINVKGSFAGDEGVADFNVGYGVRFGIANPEYVSDLKIKTFTLFSDGSGTGADDYLLDERSDMGNNESLCLANSQECLEVSSISRGNYIKRLCSTVSGVNKCFKELNVSFKRPNPNMHITAFHQDGSTKESDLSNATICVASNDGTVRRKVFLQDSGQISVQNIESGGNDICEKMDNIMQ